MENYSEFYSFMSEYTDFFFSVMKKEEQKMKALYSRDLTKINEILRQHQETEKLVADYESRRMELHKSLGLEGKTFREIIDESTTGKEELMELYSKLSGYVMNTKEYNSKSLDFAKMNLEIVDSIKSDGISDAQCYDSSGKTTASANNKSTFFNAKV